MSEPKAPIIASQWLDTMKEKLSEQRYTELCAVLNAFYEQGIADTLSKACAVDPFTELTQHFPQSRRLN